MGCHSWELIFVDFHKIQRLNSVPDGINKGPFIHSLEIIIQWEQSIKLVNYIKL